MAQPARAYSPESALRDASTPDREPFGAFFNDDHVQAVASEIAEQRGWSASNIRKGGLNTALRLLGVAPLPKFLVVDIENEPLEEACKVLNEIARMGSLVVAVGTTNDVDYFRAVMRAGVRDYLVKPLTSDKLGAVLADLENPSEDGQLLGRLVGVMGARGGVGASTMAINLAWIMSERLNRRAALVDMDIYTGSIALALDMEPTRGLREAFDDPKRVDQVFLQNAMEKVGKGLHVLATEEALDDQVQMSDDKMSLLAQTMHANFDTSILDLPRRFVLREAGLLAKCHEFVLVAEPTLQSLRDTNRIKNFLALCNREARVHVILNRVTPQCELTVKEFEEGLEASVRCTFPIERKMLAKSTMKGEPLSSALPKHKISVGLHRLCIELAGIPEDTRKKGVFRSLFARH
ncbi:MAG: P-loop NTPase [Pseudomonadota bacterium]